MKMTDRLFCTGLFLLLILLPLQSLSAITVEHRQGSVTLPAVPQRVVVFDLSVLDTLEALGVEVIGVPKAHLPQRMAHYRDARYADVGSLFEPNLEVLAALKPDLIILGGRSAPAYRSLRRLAPTIDLTQDYDDFIGGLKSNVRTLARIFDQVEAAEQQLDSIDQQVMAIRSLTGDAGKALVIITNGGRLAAYGPGSRFGWIHDVLGMPPVVSGLRQHEHGDPISFEYLLQQNPDYLFVIDRDTAINTDPRAARATLDNQLVHQTRAWQQNRVVYLDPVNWYIVIAGLSATPAMLEEFRAALQP